MKAVCINPGSYKLTKGNIYDIQPESTSNKTYVNVIDDTGAEATCYTSRFEKIPEKFQPIDPFNLEL